MINWTLSGLLLVALVVTSNVVNAAPASQKSEAPTVVVARVKKMFMSPVSWVKGTVISLNDQRLTALAGGKLKTVVDTGALVRENDVLARLENSVANTTLKQLRMEVERAREELEYRREEVRRMKEVERQHRENSIRFQQAVSERDFARNNLKLARLELQKAQESRKQQQLRAPFAGKVIERYRQAGDPVEPGDEILRLISVDSLEVRAPIPPGSLQFIQQDAAIPLRAEDSGITEGQGRVLGMVSNTAAGNTSMQLRVNPGQLDFHIGQGVLVGIPQSGPRDVLAVPRNAILKDDDSAFVFAVDDDNIVRKISVTPGLESASYIEVSGSIGAATRVVVRGIEQLKPNMKVHPVSE